MKHLRYETLLDGGSWTARRISDMRTELIETDRCSQIAYMNYLNEIGCRNPARLSVASFAPFPELYLRTTPAGTTAPAGKNRDTGQK